MARPLDQLVVFEAATTVAGQLLGRLLAEQGAAVHAAAEPSVRFHRDFLYRGKTAGWPAAVNPAVVVLDDLPASWAADRTPEALRARWPGAVCVAITPYGLSGPLAAAPGDDMTADAMSGAMALRGQPDGGPNAAPPHVVQQAAAHVAYTAVLQRLLEAPAGAAGCLVDVSLAEVALLFAELHLSYVEYAGVVPNRRLTDILSLFGMVRTADGWMMAFNWGQEGWITANAFLEGAGLTQEVAEGRLTELAKHVAEIRASVAPWFASRSKWQVTQEAQALRLHWGASAEVGELVNDPHVRETRALEAVPSVSGGDVSLPRLALPPLTFTPAPARPRRRPIRVLDLTHYWAGPSCARFLADFGMEVVKVEPPGKPDPVRLQIPRDNLPSPAPLERGWWNGLNVGKQSLGLDLRSAAGRAAFLRLVANADVVVENYSATAMTAWGLTWEVLRAANPELVYVSMSAFGRQGPYSSYIAFGSNLEPLSGIPELVGDPDGPPTFLPSAIPDTFGAFVGAAAVLTGLHARDRGAGGAWFEISQHQSLLALIAWAFHEYGTTGRAPTRSAIHADGNAYRDVLRCSGDDDWLLVSVADAALLARALAAIGAPGEAEPAGAFAAWARGRTAGEAAAQLRAVGVAAMPVLTVAEALGHEQHRARGFFRELTTAAGFTARGMTFPCLVDGKRPGGSQRTPRFGSATRSILAAWGGLDAAEIDALIREGAAGEDFTVDWAPTRLPLEEWFEVGAATRA